MKEKTLLNISLIIAVLGTIILFFVSQIPNKPIQISNLEESSQEDVYIEGSISKLTETERVIFLDVSQKNNSITVILFKENNQSFSEISEQDNVKLKGELKEYQGSLEIIADWVKIE